MSLWPIKTAVPELYTEWDGVMPGIHYNDYLVTPPRHYSEALMTSLPPKAFYYLPGADILALAVGLDILAWPGWSYRLALFSADTGAFQEWRGLSFFLWAWLSSAGPGSYGQIYACGQSFNGVAQVDPYTLAWAAGQWTVAPGDWDPGTIFTWAVVNRQDHLIAGVSTWNLEIYDLAVSPPALLHTLRLPNTLGGLAYENRDCLWLVTNNGLIAKARYRAVMPRWEMLSSVQDPSADALAYLCAFDSLRNRLAVFRQRPDAADGASQSQIEFYRPLVQVAGLTDPVPVSRVRAADRVDFVTHLYGSQGEGVTPYVINAALEAPALGTVLTPVAATGLNGAGVVKYLAPAATGEETLTVTATITDGA